MEYIIAYALVIGCTLILLAIVFEPMRKALGFLLIILGIIECLTVVGSCIGIPQIFIGSLFFFWK